MKNFRKASMLALSSIALAEMSTAGGWEASTLDTSFMYNNTNPRNH